MRARLEVEAREMLLGFPVFVDGKDEGLAAGTEDRFRNPGQGTGIEHFFGSLELEVSVVGLQLGEPDPRAAVAVDHVSDLLAVRRDVRVLGSRAVGQPRARTALQ